MLSKGQRRVAYAVVEAIMSDEDEQGALVPGRPEVCEKAVAWLDDAIGRSSADLRRGFGVLIFVMDWLPFFVIFASSRASRLPLARRLAYIEALESSRIGLLCMLVTAFKVPMCLPSFEEAEELTTTGFDRATTATRRELPAVSGEEVVA